MGKHFIFFVVIFIYCSGFAQDERDGNYQEERNRQYQDSLNNRNVDVQLSGKTHYTDYKKISFANDSTVIDTTLSMLKDYRFNFLREDDFEKLFFHNQGQTYNELGRHFTDASVFPEMGFLAKHFNYYEIEDIFYYHVPTPTSELMYRTGHEQGQVLDAFITFNTSKRHNLSLAYKGLRSLGQYRNSLASHGNMRFTYSYSSKNNAYSLRAHITAQDLSNTENGGLTTASLENFTNKDPNFRDRGRMEVNFDGTTTFLRGNRYFLDHGFKLWQRKDSITNKRSYLKIGHVFNYERKHYDFNQATANETFGLAFDSSIQDKVANITMDNQAYLALKSPLVLGELKFKAAYRDYEQSYDNTVFINDQLIPRSLEGNAVTLGGTWKTQLRKFNLNIEANSIVEGDLTGNALNASADFKQDSLFTFKGSFITSSRSPNLNMILSQSNYISYNWLNSLKNERTRTLAFQLKSDKILDAEVELSQIDNFTHYSDTTSTQLQPKVQQFDKTVNYLRVKVGRDFKVGKFGLNNTILYQKVAQGSSVLRVPELVTRNTLYFADYLFKGDPLFLQTGITLKYFTKYYANGYNPLLSEFTLQNEQEIGGYPVIDFFINAEIQRTRLYFKLEHINSGLSGPNYYSAPNYPYRDFVIRFGLVWNFFI